MQRLDQDPYISPDVGVLPGVKMQEVDNDLLGCSEFGDLPEDISEFLNEDFLRDIVDSDTLFDGLNCEDELNNFGDLCLPGGLPATDNHLQGQEEELAVQPDKRRKRPRVPQSQLSTNESTPHRPKRQRVPGRLNDKMSQVEPPVTQGSVTHSEPSPRDMAGLSTTPPRILQLHHPIQFIAIPDTPGYPIVQTLSFSPPVIGLPIPNSAATPTYILVPAASPPSKQYVPPLSPVDGAVAPVQMSSSPPGSLSDTASKAMSPSCASPLSPSNEMSACKESPHSVLDIPCVVKDYIQKMKAHVSQTCQNMEESLSLTSHYVDVQVSQRDVVYRCGRNTHKFLDKELIIMGDTDRKQSLLGRSQIFQGSSGVKNKRCILLLGNAGMGKTTLIKKLCLDWSRDCIPQFDFVFLLDGKALTSKQPGFSLQTLLLNLSAFAPPCSDLDAVFAQITAAPKRVLIFFDGFDELRDYETLLQPQEKDLMTTLQRDSKAQTFTVKQLYSALLQRVLLPGCTLLLSARPRGTATQLLRRTDRFFEVCGFSSANMETYVSKYFEDPVLRASALDCLKSCEYLRLLCWNPGLCRLVCLLLELSRNAEALPKTLTELCNQVIHLKMKKYTDLALSPAEPENETTAQAGGPHTHISSSSQGKRGCRNAGATPTTWVRTQRARRGKKQERKGGEAVGEGGKSADGHVGRTGERELLSQLSALAWDGVKGNSCILNTERKISSKLKVFGLRTGLLMSNELRTGQADSSGKKGTEKEETQINRTGANGKSESKNTEVGGGDLNNDDILLWSSPFLQSYLAAVHLSLSRTVSDRVFLQSLPFLSAPKGRRRPQWETLELTQRFAFGFLFYSRTELQLFHSYTEVAFRNMLLSKQALVTKHLEDFSRCDLMPAQVLEACHYIYEATLKHSGDSRERGCMELIDQLAATLPEVLTFRGVPLNPSDVFAVQNVLERGGYEGQKFCLDLEDSGIQISGLKTLVEHSNIRTYRACIADAITLWEQLEHSDDQRQKAVSKFKINPLKATQVCHVDHLAKLVNVHVNKRLSNSSRQCDFIFAEGVPAVQELHKLEFELGPENGPKALSQLWELLPGLHNLQHLDLENSKIGDIGAEELARALVSLCLLEVLNLSQNCIGDHGVRTLANTLKDLPKLHCLSLYSNVISDEGAKSLAAVLPHMTSLTDLDVKYNKLTDVGAQSLGISLRNCKTLKTLRMWNQCIPYGVFERLQQQDSRILLH